MSKEDSTVQKRLSLEQSLVAMIIVATVMQMDDVLAGLGPKENKGSPAGLIQPACLVGEGKLTALSKAYIVRLLTIVLVYSA